MKFCYITSFNLPKQDLNLSYKTDLDFLNCFGRKNSGLITDEIQHFSADVAYWSSTLYTLNLLVIFGSELFPFFFQS